MICCKRSAQAAGRSRVEECRAPGPPRAESQDVGKNEQREKWQDFRHLHTYLLWTRGWWPPGQLGSQPGGAGAASQSHGLRRTAERCWGRRAGGGLTWLTSDSGTLKKPGWLLKENTKPRQACVWVCVRACVMFTGGEVEERDFGLGVPGRSALGSLSRQRCVGYMWGRLKAGTVIGLCNYFGKKWKLRGDNGKRKEWLIFRRNHSWRKKETWF